jgi:hypothetical protein
MDRLDDYLLLVEYKDGRLTRLSTHSYESAVDMVREFWLAIGDTIDRIVVAHVLGESTGL